MELLPHHTINVNGRLMDLSEPKVMGILNATPDSFFAGSRVQTEHEIAERADEIIAQGASVIDVGAFSTRPGAGVVAEDEEMRRMRHALAIVRRQQPEAVVSVDTFRPDVARMAVEEFGAAIINDVSEGGGAAGALHASVADDKTVPPMFRMVAKLRVPYVLMSVRPTVEEMLLALAREVGQLRAMGVNDILVDPGFGFGKDLEQNYALMARLPDLQALRLPILVGVSRKSMITRLLGCDTAEALNATTALHAVALMHGAAMLRVHDVGEAVEVCRIVGHLRKFTPDDGPQISLFRPSSPESR